MIQTWRATFCILFVAVLAVSCSSTRRANEFFEPPSPNPPPFLAGSIAALLTNADGFSARVVMEKRLGTEDSTAVSGVLLGLGGKLFFARDEPGLSARQSRLGGIGFIWDVTTDSGYILSEPLQGYAPISAGVTVTQVAIGTHPASSVVERIGGHPARNEQVTVNSSDGSEAEFQIWRAMDLRGFIVQINPPTNSPVLSLNLSDVRLEAPQAALFQVPEGFTKYPSAKAMMNEMVSRQLDLRQGRGRKSGDSIGTLQPPVQSDDNMGNRRYPGSD